MRAYLQGDKIVIKSNEEYAEVEALINSITNSLDVVKAACEDRNTEAFPSSTVRSMVEKIELLKTKGKEVFISRDFVEKIIESRDVYKYFEESLKRAKEEEKTFLRKMELYGKFADKLEDIFVIKQLKTIHKLYFKNQPSYYLRLTGILRLSA